jgi:dihydrofolate reductase
MGEVMAAGTRPYELLLGRGTYEIFAAHWPYVTDDPIADELKAFPSTSPRRRSRR